MKRYMLPIFLLPMFLLCWVHLSHGGTKKNILYLNSYHHGYRWSDEILVGIRSVLRESDSHIGLQIEYMDTKKYNYSRIKNSLFTLYREKFRGENFDLILVSDNNGFNFVSQYHETLFHKKPIVFCGINNFEAIHDSPENITGVVENFDLVSTLDVIRSLHPKRKKMIVIGDESATGRGIRRQIEKTLSTYAFPFQVEFWVKLTLEETKERVENLGNDTFLFFFPWYQTIKGKFYTAEEVMETIYSHSPVPIYTTWEFLLGHGAVGGRMLSGRQHGRTAAKMALRILNGDKPQDIPVQTEARGRYEFDYRVMQRLNIRQDLLPEDSLIINSPRAFYELPKELFWTIMTSLLLLLVVLVFLVTAMIGRRRVEQKITEQLSFQETLMDTIPLLVSWKDRERKYLGANRTFIDFFNIETPDDVVSRKTEDVVFDREYVRWSVNADDDVARGKTIIRKQRRKLQNRNGSTGWLEVNKVPLRDRNGRIVGILTTAENVTKEQNLEKQLLQSQKMEALGTLAGGIAHDFNNILTSIINSTELALGDLDPESRTAADLTRVLKAARRGSGVVKRILSFSRPSKEGFRATDLSEVVYEVVSLMDGSLPSTIKISSKINSGSNLVEADPTQIHQVILNLCTNSYHALRENGGLMKVQLDELNVEQELAATMNISPGTYIRIRVADNGSGISPEIIDNIFDPFFSTKDISEGTGLGLAVVHGIVKGHRGGLQVSSEPGHGTVFSIYLPVTTETRRKKTGFTPVVAVESLSILFVEDDRDQLDSIPRILEEMGHRVTATGDPEQGLAMIRSARNRFDLVITDFDMPVMNGVEMSLKLGTIPVILVSGRQDALEMATKSRNIVTVLIKPYDGNDLQSALARVAEEE
ncbi:hybrid sensor histidine kinase/response regulator [Desulfomarina sp.]